MKPHPEMIEGPEALTRFENTMKALFASRKCDLPAKNKAHKPTPRRKVKK